MYLVDEDCRYLFMNERYTLKHVFDSTKSLKYTYDDFHSAEESAIFHKKVTEVFETGNALTDEHSSQIDGRCFMRTFSPVKGAKNSAR